MPIPTHAPMLRALAERIRLPRIEADARTRGTSELLRLTIHYFDGRALDSVATLRRTSQGETHLEIQYERPLVHPLVYAVPDERYQLLMAALAQTRFDSLRDQANMPAFLSTDVWLLERAAGAFTHGILLAPALVPDIMDARLGVYLRLANAIYHALPEALKTMT